MVNSIRVYILDSFFFFLFVGVPLIIENSLPEYLSNEEDPDYKLFGDFMSTSRINLNIRQVYPPGEKK